jgi:alpha-L-fucosidase
MKTFMTAAVLTVLSTATLPFAAAERETHTDMIRDRDERMGWWREARFGMFVHWGLYSIPAGEWNGRIWTRGGTEWIQKRGDISADVYAETLLPKFNPRADFAAEWAETAKTAGCRYLVFTSKHHEGFALHDSKLTTFDAKDTCGRDLFREIVEAARAEGLKVGAYHSLIDWHHPHAYAGFGLPTVKGVTNEGRDNSIYVDYLHGQVEEIMSGYGPIDIVWWDFSREDCQGESWRARELISMVRRYQPHIIMNNRLYRIPEAGWPKNKDWSKGFTMDPQYGDFCTPEQKIPATGVEGVDWETCMTMNTTWGYNQHDHQWKSSAELIRNLVDIVSKGGNYLLNVGPKADGSIPEESLERMQAIGRWMRTNSESIYGTGASPYEQPSWGRYTRKEGMLYAHVFDWPENKILSIPCDAGRVSSAYLLADSETPLKLGKTGNALLIHLPEEAPDAVASVVAIKFANDRNDGSNAQAGIRMKR